jgi:hypothetical protein
VPKLAVLTTYLTSTPDPQRGGKTFVKENEVGNLQLPFSCARRGVHCFVMYDRLSPAFVKDMTNDYVHFVKVDHVPGMSCNDARFLHFIRWMEEQSTFTKVITSDCFDVTCTKNPDAFITDRFGIYASVHCDHKVGDKSRVGNNIHRLIVKSYGDVPQIALGKPALNPGLIGGFTRTLLPFFREYYEEIKNRSKAKYNANLPVFNVKTWKHFAASSVYCAGYPFHSQFGKYETHSKAYFIHK